MKAKSIKGKTPHEIKAALEQILAEGYLPTLAIVFLSVKQDSDAVCDILDEAGIAIFGATSNGEFINEDFEQGSIAMLLLDLNPEHFCVQFAEMTEGDERQKTKTLAKEAFQKFTNPCFLISGSSLSTDIEELVEGIKDVASPHVNMAGGMAGDDHTFTSQVVFTNNARSDKGVILLVFDQDKMIMKARAFHGWKAVGTDKIVTHSEGNRVYSIDNIPTLDLFLKFSGYDIMHPNLEFELVTNCPLQLQREHGQPLMRPAYNIRWDDHSMDTSGKLPVGSRIRFSLPPDFDNIQEVIDASKKLQQEEIPEADAVLIYNCGGRLLSFGPLMGEEIKGIREIWNVPLAGMFSNAEIGPTIEGGDVEMHNLTTCIVVLKEK